MADFSIFGEISGDSSGFTEAVNQAKESLGSLSEIAGGVFAGLGAATLFQTITGGMKEMVDSTLDTGNKFQSWGTVINNVAGDAGTAFQDMGNEGAAAGAKAALSALEAQQALEAYNDKVQKVSDEIKDVMKGQNILDEQKSLYQKLNDLAQQHADKVLQLNDNIDQANQDLADREAGRQQSMDDTLQDMVSSNENKKADTAEKRQAELAQATNDFTRQMLQKKYAAEDKLADDSFQRQYDLKKAQLQRNIDEQNAQDVKQTATKISRLQDQISKENTAYDAQQEKLKQQSDDRVIKYQEENDKKLKGYQDELAKEEKSYQESLQKRALQAAASGGGGGGGGDTGMMKLQKQFLSADDSFSKTKTSAQELHKYLEDLSDTTPFKLEDIEQSTQQLELMGVDAKSLLPTIMNISGHFQKDLGTTTSDVLMAMRGQTRQLRSDFNITGENLQDAFGPTKIKSANDILTSLQKITNQHFGDGIDQENQLAGRHMTQLDNQITKIKLGVLGFNDLAQPDPNGLFSQMLNSATNAADFLQDHRKEIIQFGKEVISVVAQVATAVTPIALALGKALEGAFKYLSEHGDQVQLVLKAIGTIMAIAFTSSVLTVIFGIVGAIAAFIGGIGEAITVAAGLSSIMGIIGTVIAALGGPITLVAIAIVGLSILLITHWNDVVKIFNSTTKAISGFIGSMVNFIKDNFQQILLFLGPAGWLVLAIIEVHNHWNDILKAIKSAVGDSVKAVVDTFNTLIKSFSDIFTTIGNFFKQQTANFLSWGKNLGLTFINGIKDALKDVGSILTGPIEAAFKMFKGKSPPTEGPLKDIDEWGFNIGSAWVEGFSGAIDGLKIKPSFDIPGMNNSSVMGSQQSSQVYNSTTNAPQITQTNTFNVKGEANAQNIAQYLGFQLEHKGLV